ncbi:MAG: hypothetical protein U0172_12190 [Nitrospiraceae bacterium]
MRRVGYLTIIGALAVSVMGCAGTPRTSRTAVIQDVNIGESLAPTEIVVQTGDEIRWVNVRKQEVSIEIPNLKSGDLACERGFSGWMGGVREDVELEPNQTASLCFKKPGSFPYNVRAETAVSGGKKILPGTIRITPAPAAGTN